MDYQERLIHLDGTFNTRDFGGYLSKDGRRVKTGRLFRSDDLFLLSPADQEKLASMGINTIIDYRNQFERNKRPNKEIKGAKTHILSPDDDLAALASGDLSTDQDKINKLIEQDEAGQLDTSVDLLKTSMLNYVNDPHSQKIYQKVLQILGSDEGIISIQHCRGGKDRTGYGAAITLLLLGVSEEDVIKDYLLTAKFNQERNHKRMTEYQQYTGNKNVLHYLASAMDTREDVIASTIDEMKRLSGSPIDYIQDYLGATDTFIQKFRTIYLEDQK